MTQAQPNLLELAKQGNAKAIATLMNRQLQPKGITVKVALKDGCLQIMLESTQVPNQQALVAFIRKGITGLGVSFVERVKVYGRKTGEEFPAWSQEFELVLQTKSTSPSLEVPVTNQPSVKRGEPCKNKSSLPTQNNSSRIQQNINSSTKKVTSQEALALTAFRILLGCSFLLLFLNWILAILTFIAAYWVAKKTPEGKAAKVRQKLEDQDKAKALVEAQRLKQEEEKLKQEEERLKQEEEQKDYILLLDSVNSPIKNLQTNLAHTTLEEFRKVQARINVGVSYKDLPSVLASAKFAVQQFERSNDYNISPYLNKLITKIMFYYEFSLQCLARKVNRFNAAIITVVETPGIPAEDELGKRIKQEFPDLQPKYIGFGSYYYEFDITLQAVWIKASELSDKLQEILEVAC